MSAMTMGCLLEGLDAGETQPSVLSWLDLAHSATPVVALERPVAGIARCVIAPVPLLWLPGARRSVHHDSRRLRCLAVNDTGHLASSDLVFAGNAEALLAAVRQSLKGPGIPELAGCSLLDTAAALRDPVQWRLWAPAGPERPMAVAGQWAMHMARVACGGNPRRMADRALHFLRRLGHRLEQCVDWVLAGPSDELLGVLPHRPHLSHGMARRLLVSRLYRDLAATSQASAWPRSPTSTSRDDPLSPGHELAAKLARTFGSASMREFAALWLDLLPELPAMHMSGCTLRLLRSLDCVVRLGRALRNCLAKTDAVVDYLAESICFVAVETEEGAPVGLVSVALQRCGSRIVREVREAVGPGNEPLANSLVTAAEAYVDRMARDAAAFECFVRVGEALARLGDSESG